MGKRHLVPFENEALHASVTNSTEAVFRGIGTSNIFTASHIERMGAE